MRLRNFKSPDVELPPVDLFVLGYWEGEPQPFTVVRWTGGLWVNTDGDDDYRPPTGWHKLPGGDAINDLNNLDEAVPDLDTDY